MRNGRCYPTLLLPGIAGGSPSLIPMERHLLDSGITAIRVPFPIVLMRGIRHYGHIVARHVMRMYARYSEPVNVIGWSMGGTNAVSAMRHSDAASATRRIIAVCSPLDGSWPAHLAAHRLARLFLKAPREIVPGSALLRELTALTDDPTRAWEIATVNGPFALDPLAPGPLKRFRPDLAILGPYTHLAPLGDAGLLQLLVELVKKRSLAAD